MTSEPDDANGEPAAAMKWPWSEVLFQAALDGLLVLLYMTAVMVFMSELFGRPLAIWMWAIQGLTFALVFAGGRMVLARRVQVGVVSRAKMLRQRWTFFVMAGVVVSAASAAEMILSRSARGPMAGLSIAGTLLALAGAVGLVRARRATTDGSQS